MARCGRLWVVAAIFLLGACQAAPPGVTPAVQDLASFAPVPFRCPAAGTVVTHWNADPVRYAGAKADDPEVCLIRGMGRPQEQLYLFFGAPSTEGMTAGEAVIRAQMARFWPLEPGKEVEFIYTDAARFGVAFAVHREHWRVLRAETVDLDSGQHETVVVSRMRDTMIGPDRQVEHTYWIDRGTGAVLRTQSVMYRGINTPDPSPRLPPVGLSLSLPAPAQ